MIFKVLKKFLEKKFGIINPITFSDFIESNILVVSGEQREDNEKLFFKILNEASDPIVFLDTSNISEYSFEEEKEGGVLKASKLNGFEIIDIGTDEALGPKTMLVNNKTWLYEKRLESFITAELIRLLKDTTSKERIVAFNDANVDYSNDEFVESLLKYINSGKKLIILRESLMMNERVDKALRCSNLALSNSSLFIDTTKLLSSKVSRDTRINRVEELKTMEYLVIKDSNVLQLKI